MARSRSTKDQVLVDNVDELDPESGQTVRFEKGSRLSQAPKWAQDRWKDSKHLFKDVRVSMQPTVTDDDGSDDEDDEPEAPKPAEGTQEGGNA